MRPTLRILIVDDSEDFRRLMLFRLRDTNHEIDVAEDGAVAVALVRERSYDLVFMDIDMPVMDGYEATRAIRLWERSERRARMPIIAFTSSDDVRRSREAGCDAHLEKPAGKHRILELIERHARDASARGAIRRIA